MPSPPLLRSALPLCISAEARLVLAGGLGCIYESKNTSATAHFLTYLTTHFAEVPYKKSSGGKIRSVNAKTAEAAWPAMLQQCPKMTEKVLGQRSRCLMGPLRVPGVASPSVCGAVHGGCSLHYRNARAGRVCVCLWVCAVLVIVCVCVCPSVRARVCV